MTDTKGALARFACPACGGEARWDPGKRLLVCPYCSTESAAQPPTEGAVVEHDLGNALTKLLDLPRGWQAAKRAVRCASCRAIAVLDPARQAQNCEFCGSAQLLPYDEDEPAFRPESVLPFTVSATQARETIRRWYGKRWLAPNALKRRALTDTVHGVYLPYCTFDAQVHATWTAEAGHYHYTTETYREGNQVRTRQVRHVRWVPASGAVDHFFDDNLVCASVGVERRLLQAVEPFPTKELAPYDPGFVAGWVVERYQVDLADGARRSRAAMDAKLAVLCASRVPGDTYRNLQVRADWSGQTFKHILAPAWLLTYDYGRRSYQCIVNGATGAIAGDAPKSWIKVTLLVLAAMVVAVVLLSVQGR
jgi:LSD1 subclass zinc finger protein